MRMIAVVRSCDAAHRPEDLLAHSEVVVGKVQPVWLFLIACPCDGCGPLLVIQLICLMSLMGQDPTPDASSSQH